MGMDEVDIQPPRPHQQQQPPPPPPPHPQPPPQQQQITPTQQHPPRHPHPLQRSGGGGGGGGLTLSLPLQASPSGVKIASASPPGVSVAPPANGGAAPSTANGGGGGAERGHGHRDDCWSEGATNTLIEAWGDRYLELNRGNLKQKHWKDVADAVSNRESGSKTPKTDVQCKNRLDTLKKKYKLEKTKIFGGGGGGGGGGTSKWPFFNKLDELIGPSRKNQQQKALVQVQVQPQIQLQVPPASSSKPLKRSLAEEPLNHHNPTQGQGQGQGSTLAQPAHFHMHHLAPPANNSASSKSDETPDTTDSYHNGIDMTVNGSKGFKKRRLPENPNPFKELTGAIIKFGEVYERVETSKLQNFIDLEKQRMEFMREMEIQRMQLFVQTQLELAKMKHGKQGNNTEHYL